jgi:hypothetical protein
MYHTFTLNVHTRLNSTNIKLTGRIAILYGGKCFVRIELAGVMPFETKSCVFHTLYSSHLPEI